jgi:hypothetical protein
MASDRIDNMMTSGLFHRALIRFAASLVLALGGVLAAVPARAANTSVVTDNVPGLVDVVKAAPYSHWLAAWAEVDGGGKTLWVIDANNGKLQEVTSSAHPGGICWIPRKEKLFYSKATYNDQLKNYRVFYYEYDPLTQQSSKIADVRDVLETFKLDPLAAEDGSLVFHVTYDNLSTSFGTGTIPTFHYYYPDEGSMETRAANANIGADFDLASDGLMLYWPLYDENTGDLMFVGWDTIKNDETWNARYYSYNNPADGGGMLRIDSPNQNIALLVQSNVQPRMQLCIYGWQGRELKAPIPVFLEVGEEIVDYDWIGITGKLYAVIVKTMPGAGGSTSKAFSLEEIDITGVRKVLVSTTDQFGFADYAPGSGNYYYSVINRQGRTPRSLIIRVQP